MPDHRPSVMSQHFTPASQTSLPTNAQPAGLRNVILHTLIQQNAHPAKYNDHIKNDNNNAHPRMQTSLPTNARLAGLRNVIM